MQGVNMEAFASVNSIEYLDPADAFYVSFSLIMEMVPLAIHSVLESTFKVKCYVNARFYCTYTDVTGWLGVF